MTHPAMDFGRIEDRLLLTLLRHRISGGFQEEIEQLIVNAAIDYDFLMTLAYRNAVRSMVIEGLAPYKTPIAQAAIKNYREANTRRKLVLMEALFSLLKHLNEKQIAAIPLKGMAIALQFYPSRELRDFNDIDILIKQEDASRAKAMLLDLGFFLNDEQSLMPEKAYLRSHYHYRFANPQGQYDLEVHWTLAPHYLGEISNESLLWRNATQTIWYGIPVWLPLVEDLFLYLCTHGGRHYWSRLSWICDLGFILNKTPNLRWDYILEQAQQIDAIRYVLTASAIAQRLLLVPIPNDIEDDIHRDKQIETLFQMSYRNIFAPTEARYQLIEQYQFQWIIQPKLSARLRYLGYILKRRLILTEEDFQALKLPRILYPLYYVLRPIRLLRRYGHAIVRILPTRKGPRSL